MVILFWIFYRKQSLRSFLQKNVIKMAVWKFSSSMCVQSDFKTYMEEFHFSKLQLYVIITEILRKLMSYTVISLRNSPWQLAIAEGFADANSAFIVINSEIFLLRWLIPSNIYIPFKIFNTYFLKKLLFTNKRYHLHVLEKCLYVLQEVRSVIYFKQFIHPLSLMFLNSSFHFIFLRSRTRHYRISTSCSNVLISMTSFAKKRECQSFHVLPRQHLHVCYLMIVLVRAVLSTKLVLRYKHKFEATL